MAGARPYRNPIFGADIRELGGVVSVHTDRCHSDGEPVFRVGHISGGGDVAFLSLPIAIEDHANCAAWVLAEFTGAVSRETTAADFRVRS
jgi:hypothetical protein